MKRGLLTSVCVLSGLILSGCGGGGGGELTGAGGAPTITTLSICPGSITLQL